MTETNPLGIPAEFLDAKAAIRRRVQLKTEIQRARNEINDRRARIVELQEEEREIEANLEDWANA